MHLGVNRYRLDWRCRLLCLERWGQGRVGTWRGLEDAQGLSLCAWMIRSRLLTVTVYDDEIAALAADDADLPAGRLTVSAPRIQGFRAWSARRWTPPTRLRFVTGAII